MFYPRGETISFPRKKPLHSVQSWMMFCPRPASDVSYSNHSPNPLTEFLSKTTLKPENCEAVISIRAADAVRCVLPSRGFSLQVLRMHGSHLFRLVPTMWLCAGIR